MVHTLNRSSHKGHEPSSVKGEIGYTQRSKLPLRPELIVEGAACRCLLRLTRGHGFIRGLMSSSEVFVEGWRSEKKMMDINFENLKISLFDSDDDTMT